MILNIRPVGVGPPLAPVDVPSAHSARLATWYGLPVSDTDFGGCLSDTVVLHFDTFLESLFLTTFFMRHKTTAQWNNRLLLVTK